MLQHVWGDQEAREEVVTRCIHQLQVALEGDSEQQHLIKPIPRQGYRLTVATAPIISAAGAPAASSMPENRSRNA